ncbi:zinc-dependent alcohol dehydrogenase family protein [Jannaschia seohaensis]|uniref:alcohol dehydrogenase n=1 Tax=Jannaschia seohaensis TaxID=475081 RepID=A0A2Y9C997_9RHOB|nr:zinc-dependent alcohol dehydrogenase family protein [Jannaschia seohaensis]PWJ10066.1 propanol-preferring alcohol dehydrogenase [Jannaschia seohaensis]SSA51833.1 alcohol dehydrogenase, propanol-preferring [Jannaschia seohaensis]
MRAMVFGGSSPRLELQDVPIPVPGKGQVRIAVEACGVCRTDLHVVDGDLTEPKIPLIPGHEIVGRIDEVGSSVTGFSAGQRVGVPWLGHTCGACTYCRSGHENLCDAPGFTGYTINGGYAEFCIADAKYVFALPDRADPVSLAPLLCAGLIGYRSYKLAGDLQTLGIYGFGAAAHILCQIARHQGVEIYAFTRDGDRAAQDFARSLGAIWAGGSSEPSPMPLDAAIIFAPVGALVPIALRSVRKGGRVVCGGIHMSDIPGFPYADLWEERAIMSVANLTRQDGIEFFPLADAAGVRTETIPYPLESANEALDDLREGRLQGAAVLTP